MSHKVALGRLFCKKVNYTNVDVEKCFEKPFENSFVTPSLHNLTFVYCKFCISQFFLSFPVNSCSFLSILACIFNFSAWQSNPTITIVDTTTWPIEKVDFPTVTICPKSYTSDRWGPVTKIFDYLKLSCTPG